MRAATMVDDSQEVKLRLDQLTQSVIALRDEMRTGFQSVNCRIDETNARLDGTDGRIGGLMDSFDQFRGEVGSRLLQFELTLAGFGEELFALRDRVERVEATLVLFDGRLIKIERRLDDDRNGDGN